MSDETLDSPQSPNGENTADQDLSPASPESRRAGARSMPRLGAALSVLWWDERGPSSGE
jgi:hypothetical protein